MSDDFTLEMNELNRLAVDLGRASITAPLKASAAIRKTAFDIEATAKTFVPVDTGATKNSIHATSGDARPLGAGSLAANNWRGSGISIQAGRNEATTGSKIVSIYLTP